MKTVHSMDGVQTKMGLQDGKLITGTVQDCTPILERAKELHRSGAHGSAEMKLAMTIPDVVVETYCNVNGIEFSEFMQNPVHVKRMLNDPALRDLRIWDGAV